VPSLSVGQPGILLFVSVGTQFKKIRYGFEGIPVPDSLYLNTDVSEYPFGSGSSIRYITK